MFRLIGFQNFTTDMMPILPFDILEDDRPGILLHDFF